MAGGLAGTALLMQGTARADTAVATTTSITGTTDLLVDPGIPPVLKVDVSVAAQSGSAAPSGSVLVGTTTRDGTIVKCTANLTSGSGRTASGSCTLHNLPFGMYKLTAGYLGSSAFARSDAPVYQAPVGSAPAWTASSPSLTASPRSYYEYTFAAKGVPAPTYKLENAPVWLNIDETTGHVFGWLPWTVRSFSYTVVASNAVGEVRSGYTVNGGGQQHVTTWLACSRWVIAGQGGSCTLNVRDNGSAVATNVNADIQLPRQLRARWCTTGWGWGWGWGRGPSCKIHDNIASWHVGRMWPGQTKSFVVFFTAKRSFWNGPRVTVTVTGDATWQVGPGAGPIAITYSYAKVTIFQNRWW